LGGFFFTQPIQAKILSRDKMVYKISRTVFSLNDLMLIHKNMENLKCMYGESLLNVIFQDQFYSKNKKFYEFRETFSKTDQKFYLRLMEFSKLLVYSRSQNVVVDPNIEKYFYLMATQNKCSLDAFNSDKSFNTKFREIVELEIFVRSRFLPTEKNSKTTKTDIDKAVLASKSLLKSIARQIEEEVYW